MTLDYEFIVETFPKVLAALPTTIFITFFSVTIGAIVGFFIALIHIKRIPVINQIIELYISFFRSVPIIILLFCSYYGMPKLINCILYSGEKIVGTSQISGMMIACLVFALYSVAFVSELIRGALSSVDMKQMEAAHAVGMTKFQSYTRIIIPQAIIVALPNFFNFVLATLKNTSLVFAISVHDIMTTAKVNAEIGYRFIEAYLMVGVIYIVVGTIMAKLFKYIENRSKGKMGIII